MQCDWAIVVCIWGCQSVYACMCVYVRTVGTTLPNTEVDVISPLESLHHHKSDVFHKLWCKLGSCL